MSISALPTCTAVPAPGRALGDDRDGREADAPRRRSPAGRSCCAPAAQKARSRREGIAKSGPPRRPPGRASGHAGEPGEDAAQEPRRGSGAGGAAAVLRAAWRRDDGELRPGDRPGRDLDLDRDCDREHGSVERVTHDEARNSHASNGRPRWGGAHQSSRRCCLRPGSEPRRVRITLGGRARIGAAGRRFSRRVSLASPTCHRPSRRSETRKPWKQPAQLLPSQTRGANHEPSNRSTDRRSC